MSRLASWPIVVIAGICAFALQASAQGGHQGLHAFVKQIPILDAQGNTVATISAQGGVLTIVDAGGNELFRSSQASPQQNLPPLSAPGFKADASANAESLRRDVDTLARSVTELTTRVNLLSQQ